MTFQYLQHCMQVAQQGASTAEQVMMPTVVNQASIQMKKWMPFS
jgi:hypothetical protein